MAIIISAAFQLFADLFTKGINAESFRVFAVFFVSAFATMVSIVLLIELLEKIKSRVNQYLLLLIAMIVVSVVNTLIYCCLVDLVSNHLDNISELLSASLIGKSIAIASSFVAFYLINIILKKKH